MNTSTNRASNEMFFQLIALLLAIIIVHTIFVTVVRPNADSTIRHHAEMVAAGEEYQVPRSFFIVIKDLEQEACFILMFWSLAIMGYKTRTTIREQRMLNQPQSPLPKALECCQMMPRNSPDPCNHCPMNSRAISYQEPCTQH